MFDTPGVRVLRTYSRILAQLLDFCSTRGTILTYQPERQRMKIADFENTPDRNDFLAGVDERAARAMDRMYVRNGDGSYSMDMRNAPAPHPDDPF